MAVLRRTATLEQFLTLPEEEPALEFENGRITQKVSPKGKHSGLQVELIERFDRFARPTKLARAFSELHITFQGRSYVPDVAVYRWARLPVDAIGRIANDFTEAPDLVVEIAPPEQSVMALVRRCLWYVAHGVPVALLVDPADESVLSFRPSQIPQSLTGSDRIEIDEILPGFALTVQELFDSLRVD